MAKLKRGITNVAYAPATYNAQAGTLTYGDVRYLVSDVAGGREYSADPRGESQKIYADSIAVYGETVNDGYDINLTLLSIFDEQFREDWLNEVKDDNGVAEYANAEEYPYYALIIHEDTADGVGLISVYYYCQASGRPSDSGKTAEGGAFEHEFPQYPLVSSPRPTDKLVRYQIHGKEKLTSIPEPSGVITPMIELEKHRIVMKDGDQVTLSAVTVPEDITSIHLTAGAADSSVATAIPTIDTAGCTITAEGAGNTIVTVQITVDGVTYSDTCTVIVEE